MTWLSIVKLLLSIADRITARLDTERQLEIGREIERASSLRLALELTRIANEARNRERDRIRASGGLRDEDPFSRT